MWTAAYVCLIVVINWGFSVVPLVPMPTGEMWPPLSLAVGLVFVVRDLAQREIGHRILLAMLAGAALSWWMASPRIAIASGVAFLVSEVADWALYSFLRRPLSERIFWSSLVSTPIDSAVFLALIGHLSISGVLAMVASKMLGALLVAWLVRRREVAAA